MTAAYPLFARVDLAASEASDKVPGADLDVPYWLWAVFAALAASLIIIDLALVHRGGREPSMRESVVLSAVWIAVGLGFTVLVGVALGWSAGGQYVSGYLIEKSLSVDNVFVWAAIFSSVGIPRAQQHRVLVWGVMGALILRAIFVVAGVALLERFEATLYVFGALLIFGAYRIGRHAPGHGDEAPPMAGWVQRHLRVTPELRGRHFFVKEGGRRLATPLFMALVLVELADVVFAIDSVPAVLAISQSTFIVYSSNAFAILGLRSLYVVLAGAADKLVHLNKGLAVILAFVGLKLMLVEWIHLPTWASLAFIAVVLTITVVASMRADVEPEEVIDPDPEPHHGNDRLNR